MAPETPAGWEEGETSLHRRFEFADFAEAFAFMTRVAAEAERLEHHPDWSNSWNVVEIHLVTHDAGQVTDKDRELAEVIDGVVRPT
ncbi:MAG: 4a-hydroxytetrahydrobiopterin dehydratase [Acidimicrobiales bacterium]